MKWLLSALGSLVYYAGWAAICLGTFGMFKMLYEAFRSEIIDPRPQNRKR